MTPADSTPSTESTGRYYRSGLGLRKDVREDVDTDYHSDVVRRFREEGYVLEMEGITLKLAKEFGFCYGVERAVDYAYETVKRFPNRRIVLTGEIIHNPEVNERLRTLGIGFLGDEGLPDLDAIVETDVVLIPAFGLPSDSFERLRGTGATIVDTTCGSVLNVWKNVERYAREGRTSVVHGKVSHEETRATVSRVCRTEGAHYLVVRDLEEAERVADVIRTVGRMAESDRTSFVQRFRHGTSHGFDPDLHLERVGMANQTTMRSGESLAIASAIEVAFEERYGASGVAERFRSFDTICSATQERQDALEVLTDEPLDLLLVIGGYNSSNTGHLLEIALPKVTAYHVTGPACLVSRESIRHRPVHGKDEVEDHVDGGWLPDGAIQIGLTAGASTPDIVIGAVVARLLALRRGEG